MTPIDTLSKIQVVCFGVVHAFVVSQNKQLTSMATVDEGNLAN